MGATTHITPREVIRDFIELLDIMYQNPDAQMDELLASETFIQGAESAPINKNVNTAQSDRQENFFEFTL